MEELARQWKKPSKVVYAKMKVAFILLSSGMLKEAIDTLSTIRSHRLPDSLHRAEYHILMSRYFYDLSDYSQHEFYRSEYNRKGCLYVDSALALYAPKSFEHGYFSGLKNIRTSNFEKAAEYLQQLLLRSGLSHHQSALAASTLSDVFIRNGQTDSAASLLVTAAVADIRSATKETAAIFNLATLLFQKGDLESASRFIQKAAADASFYGSQQRKAQLSVVLPLIKEEKLRAVENEKTRLFAYALIVTASFLVLVILTTVIVRQVKKMRNQQIIINQKNTTLQHMVSEKEWLLKEIHHRVKNNLQTVVSLLESQSHYLENDALQAVQSSQHRVHAMALIHQKLYNTDTPGTVNLQRYIPELVHYLSDSFNVKNQIRFNLKVEDVELEVSQAIPLGLILNEAITNAIKYAFPGVTDKEVCVTADRIPDDQIRLTIADNGVGMDVTQPAGKSGSLGMRLMKGLAQDIGGSLGITNTRGTSVTLKFQIQPVLYDPVVSNVAL
jgi:two-component sensor histidine kinase